MDEFLFQFFEDHINGGYGDILDQLSAEDFGERIGDDESFCRNCDDDGCEFCGSPDDTPLDGDHDDTMRSIGWGTDEDYGFFGGDDESFGD